MLQSIQPAVQELHKHGIGSILDYAAESDVHSDQGVAGADSLSERNYATIVRTYEYESEKKCDSHVQIFMRALDAAKTLSGQGFAAIKVPYAVSCTQSTCFVPCYSFVCLCRPQARNHCRLQHWEIPTCCT